MKKTISFIVVAVLCLFFKTTAQDNKIRSRVIARSDNSPLTSHVSAIQIGQKLPDVLISNILNQNQKTARLSDFKGKLILLDFWATWCGACIGNFPKIDTLSEQYASEMKVIMITTEDSSKVAAFFNKRAAPPRNMILTNDTLFKTMFPYRIIPHYVWIDKNGTFLGATDDQDVNSEKIDQLLAGTGKLGHLKKDMDRSRPLYSSTDLPLENALHYAVLVKGYNPGLPSGTKDIIADKTIVGKAITNASYYDIYYTIAYGLFELTNTPPHPSSIMFEVVDQNQFKKEDFNYEFRTTTESAQTLYNDMLTDISRYFPYQVRFEKENRPFLALVINDPKLVPAVDNADLKGKSLLRLISRLNNISTEMPVFDQTGLQGNLKISLSKNAADLNSAIIELARYGLDLVEKRQEMYRFKLSDKQEQQTNAE